MKIVFSFGGLCVFLCGDYIGVFVVEKIVIVFCWLVEGVFEVDDVIDVCFECGG